MAELTTLGEERPPSQNTLPQTYVPVGGTLPPLEVNDLLCCKLKNRHDIFIVRSTLPLTVGSVTRKERLNLTTIIDEVRPIVVIRVPRLTDFTEVVEGGFYQLLTGEEMLVKDGRWVKAGAVEEPMVVGVLPSVVARWLPTP